jgi:hypothetical protein
MLRNLGITTLLLGLAACSGGDNHRPELRKLLDESPVTLRDSVTTALTANASGNAERATLVTADPVFSIRVIAAGARSNVKVSPTTGEIVSTAADGTATFDCPDAIPLVEALAIAEAEADGEAVQSVPDDDVACAFEIQVLHGEELMEVKVAPDGAVLEVEESDEFSGSSDD